MKCACGCGDALPVKSRGRKRIWIEGHQPRRPPPPKAQRACYVRGYSRLPTGRALPVPIGRCSLLLGMLREGPSDRVVTAAHVVQRLGWSRSKAHDTLNMLAIYGHVVRAGFLDGEMTWRVVMPQTAVQNGHRSTAE